MLCHASIIMGLHGEPSCTHFTPITEFSNVGFVVPTQTSFGFIAFVTSQAMITIGDRIEQVEDVLAVWCRQAFLFPSFLQQYNDSKRTKRRLLY